MRYLFIFSEFPINSGFFGMSLRNSARLFTIYLIILRSFIIMNIISFLDENKNNSLYEYVIPTRLAILLNNSIYAISLILLFISTFTDVRIVFAFLGNVVGSINVIINFSLNFYIMWIDKPQIDFRFKYFANFLTGYIFIYISILEVFLHYFLHSFCMNLLSENYSILDYVEKKSKLDLNPLNNVSNNKFINTLELTQRF